MNNELLPLFDGLHRINSYMVDSLNHPLISKVAQELWLKYFDGENGIMNNWQSDVMHLWGRVLDDREYSIKVDFLRDSASIMRDALHVVRTITAVNPFNDKMKYFRDEGYQYFNESLFSLSRYALVNMIS